MTTYVGIDVAKRKHAVAMMNEMGQRMGRAFQIGNDREGVDDLLSRLAEVGSDIVIGLEATGHYWMALFDQLERTGYAVHVLNPIQVHAYRRSGIRKRKTDSSDAFWIADYVRVAGRLVAEVAPDAHMQLKQLTRFRTSLVDQIGDAKRHLISILDLVFPEYETLFSDVFIKSSRQLLAEATSPQEFVDFDLDELTQLLRKASRGRFGREKAQAIHDLAERSIGVAFMTDAARIQISCLLEKITFLEEQLATIHDAISDMIHALPDQYLTTIPGIGDVSAAAFIGEIGDVNRFETLEALIAYAGIDPTVYESGEFKAREAHMSKRGSPHLRRALWLAANSARLHDPDLRAYYERRRAEGKSYGAIMGALCHKLLARIYVILREKRPYEIR